MGSPVEGWQRGGGGVTVLASGQARENGAGLSSLGCRGGQEGQVDTALKSPAVATGFSSDPRPHFEEDRGPGLLFSIVEKPRL